MPAKKWTKENVIEALQAFDRRGVPMVKMWKENNSLFHSARRRYGSWNKAMLAAGLQPTLKWTQQRVIDAIHRRHEQGLPLTSVFHVDRALYDAALRKFKNWHFALLAAQMPQAKPRRRWSKERVVAAIHARREQGLFLSTVWKEDEGLYRAAKIYVGGWRNALIAAGLKHFQQRWNKQKIIAGIQAWSKRGLPLSQVWKEDGALYSSARDYFGGWHTALVAARIENLPPPRRIWTHQSVIEAIQDLQRRGLPLKGALKLDLPLYHAGRKRFGGWRNALLAAGIETAPLRRWTRDLVIEAIRDRFDRDLPLANVSAHDRPLAGAAYSCFGGWSKAMVAAGLEPPAHRSWTKRRIIQAIRSRFRQGPPKVSVWKENRALGASAARVFGSWPKALSAAGIETQPNPWSRDRVLKELQAWRRQDLASGGIWRTNKPLANAAKKHFGSCGKAFAAAGLTSRRWSKEHIIEVIQNRYVEGLSLASGGEDADANLVAAATRYFGGWRTALIAAGLPSGVIPKPQTRWTEELIIRQIQERYELGLPMTTDANTSLAAAALRWFGGWHAAMLAAGLKPSRKIKWCRKTTNVKKKVDQRTRDYGDSIAS